MVMLEKIQQFDEFALLKIQKKLHHDRLDVLMKLISISGDVGLIWLLPAFALLLRQPTRPLGLLMLAALAVNAFITNIVLKIPIGRPRPFDRIVDLSVLVKLPKDCSFPSGHTSASFSVARILMLAAPGIPAIAALVMAVLMGISRIYVGVHYLTDVLAGLVLGVLTSQLVWYIACAQMTLF
ncbi:MAG: phosphatase PAP2 family protein [Butyricicoccaceae bacterium]